MRRNKTWAKFMACGLSMGLVLGGVQAPDAAAAKKPGLSKKKLTMTVGSKKVLKIKNCKTKAKWKLKKGKGVVKLTSVKKNKVTIKAKKVGKATVTARIGTVKLTCKITVKAADAAPAVTTSAAPSTVPSATPSAAPGTKPSAAPGTTPSAAPEATSSAAPGATSSAAPGSNTPGVVPTNEPQESAHPSTEPSAAPSADPSQTSAPGSLVHTEGKNSQDVQVLGQLVGAFNANGDMVSNDMDSSQYKWDTAGNLAGLYWQGTEISGTLDISSLTRLAELNVDNTGINSITFPEGDELAIVHASGSGVDVLNFSKCTGLVEINCENNAALATVKLGTQDNLELLKLSGNEMLSSLDASGCKNLLELDVSGDNMRKLDVSGCAGLEKLNAANSNFGKASNLILSGNTALKSIILDGTTFGDSDVSETLNLSAAPNLKEFSLQCDEEDSNTYIKKVAFADGAPIEVLRVTNVCLEEADLIGFWNLKVVDLSGNSLSEIYVPQECTALEELILPDNELSDLDLTGCTSLKKVDVNGNFLGEEAIDEEEFGDILILGNLPKLEYLDCGNNGIPVLDVTGCPNLKYLCCSDEQTDSGDTLTGLDLKNCPNLETLIAGSNMIKSLDLSKNTKLVHVEVQENALSSLDLTGCNQIQFVRVDVQVVDGNSITNIPVIGPDGGALEPSLDGDIVFINDTNADAYDGLEGGDGGANEQQYED